MSEQVYNRHYDTSGKYHEIRVLTGEHIMSDDITFCLNDKCNNKKCTRHKSNIKLPYIPYSFAKFEECKYWKGGKKS